MIHRTSEPSQGTHTRDKKTLRVAFDWDDAKRRLKQLAESLDPERKDSEEQARQILDRRAKELAIPLDADTDDIESIEILKFRLGGEPYALDTASILELTRITTLTKVPDCPAFVHGITNLRGDVLAIMDLRRLFNMRPIPASEFREPGSAVSRDSDGESSPGISADEQPWMLVLGGERAEFGIIIDEADEVCSIETREIFPAAVSLPSVQRDVLRGVTEDALLVLDGNALLADQRLVIDET